jgi:hypothetical protein
VAEDVLLLVRTGNRDEYRRVDIGWANESVGPFLGTYYNVFRIV